MSDERRCGTCRWWGRWERGEPEGSCRRYPPRESVPGTYCHPEVTDDRYPCGEWAATPEADTQAQAEAIADRIIDERTRARP